MKWKNQLEKKIEQQAFIDSFKTYEVFSNYIEDYFKNFFDVKKGNEFIKVERNSEKITISISECKLEVILSEPSIKFRVFNNQNQESLGQLYFSEMRFTHSGATKVEQFSEELLEKLLEKTFKPLTGSSIQVLK
ncbi:hypothetical protein PGC35_15675 [Psychrobacillus sp. PGGUH221]|uniref:hypothetical protein n=1 Tax=Psychrobacillus sp. PGGUH221 TaxID=3020058 RepID=UPI0035C73B07